MVPRIPWQCLTISRAILRGHSDSVSSILQQRYRGHHENVLLIVCQSTSTSGPQRYAQLTDKFKVGIPTKKQHAETLQHVLSQWRENFVLLSRINTVTQFFQIKVLKISNTIFFPLQSTTGRQKQPPRQGGFCRSHFGIIQSGGCTRVSKSHYVNYLLLVLAGSGKQNRH